LKKKVLYIYGGADYHPSGECGHLLQQLAAADGRFTVEMTASLDAFASLPESDYVAVVVYTTGYDDGLTPARETGLLDYVRNGGGFVGIHGAAASFRNNSAYVEMLNGRFRHHPEFHEFTVNIVDADHYLALRALDFAIEDELYLLEQFDPDRCTVVAHTQWQGQKAPMAFTRQYGDGRVAYLANGHSLRSWAHPEFRKLVLRAIAWSAGAEVPSQTINCGILGYGGAFNMGRGHAGWINETPGMRTVAMCDVNPARVEAAKGELPDLLGYYTKLDDMLALPELDLVVNILPHSLHAPTTLRCLDAGRHVVTEKPFSVTLDEANAMVDKARGTGLMLSAFHNRRWDGDYLTIRNIIDRGLIGEIFQIESGQGNYRHPSFWWRSDPAVSGTNLHDWGAHVIDWMLNLIPDQVTQVMGDFQKRVWHSVGIEDHGRVIIRFENGATADYWNSSIAALTRPKWLILGTKGAIRAEWDSDRLNVVSYASGVRLESSVAVTLPSYGSTQYYRTVADHLLMGEELAVTPEQARRVIGVIDAAQRSWRAGASVAPTADWS